MNQATVTSIEWHYPVKNRTVANKPHRYLIFLITGNPGLVSYYGTFLSHLYALLCAASVLRKSSFQIYGRSLPGFEVLRACQSQGRVDLKKPPPYGLQEQICYAEAELLRVGLAEQDRSGEFPRVVLIGHSVGAYIMLEVIRRQRALSVKKGHSKMDRPDMRILGGVALFPTVVDIARSASGRKLNILFSLPYFPFMASLIVKLLTFWLPFNALLLLVKFATGFPDDAATTTTAFLKGRSGVYQALYMARDEMAQITSDAWDAEIWGAASPTSSSQPRPKLFFYFGQDDHWVADKTRDDLIAARAYRNEEGTGGEEWRPKMEIDRLGTPHGFCIGHSVPIAEKVKGYVEEIVRADLGNNR